MYFPITNIFWFIMIWSCVFSRNTVQLYSNICSLNTEFNCNCNAHPNGIISFDSSISGYIESTGIQNYPLQKNQLSFSLWLNPNKALSSTSLHVLQISHSSNSGTLPGYFYLIYNGASKKLICNRRQYKTNDDSLDSSAEFSTSDLDNYPEKWHFVICTYLWGTMELFFEEEKEMVFLEFPDETQLHTPMFQKLYIGYTQHSGNPFHGRIADVSIFGQHIEESYIQKLRRTYGSDISTDSLLSSLNPLYIISGALDSSGDPLTTYASGGLNSIEKTGSPTLIKHSPTGLPICKGDGIETFPMKKEKIATYFKDSTFINNFKVALPNCPSDITDVTLNNPLCIQDIQYFCCSLNSGSTEEWINYCQIKKQQGIIHQCHNLNECDNYIFLNEFALDLLQIDCYLLQSKQQCESSRSKCQWIHQCYNNQNIVRGIEEEQFLFPEETQCSSFSDQTTCENAVTSKGVSCLYSSFCTKQDCSQYTTEMSCGASLNGCAWVPLDILLGVSDTQCQPILCESMSDSVECGNFDYCIWVDMFCRRRDQYCYLNDETTCQSQSSFCSWSSKCLPSCLSIDNSEKCSTQDGCTYLGCIPSKNSCITVLTEAECEKLSFVGCYFDPTTSSCLSLSHIKFNKLQVENAIFENFGNSILISFDKSTNYGVLDQKKWSCSIFFPSTTLGILGTASELFCIWKSEKELEIWLGSYSTVMLGSTLTLKANILADAEEIAFLSVSSELQIQVSSLGDIPLPVAIIKVPGTAVKLIGCENMVFDGSLSYGSGRRSLKYQWTFNNGMESFNTGPSESYSQVLINSESMIVGNLYTAQLTVYDGFGQSSSTSYTFHALAKKIPYLKSSLGSPITIKMNQSYQIPIEVEIPICLINSVLIENIHIEWRVTSAGDSSFDFSSFIANTKNPTLLIIPEFSILLSCSPVVLQIRGYDTEIYQIEPLSIAVSEITIQVQQSEIVCLIKGGNRDVGIWNDISLDGSSSYDPDSIIQNHLEFEWTCKIIDEELELETQCSTATINSFSPSNTNSIISVPQNTLSAYSLYEFVLVVKDQGDPSRYESCSTRLRTVQYTSLIEISTSSKELLVQGETKFKSKLLDLSDSTKYSQLYPNFGWKVEDAYSTIDASSNSFISNTMLLSITSDTSSSNYFIQNLDYRIMFYVVDKLELYNAAYMDMRASVPPELGSLSVFPNSGTEYTTDFTVSCENWKSKNFPLSYVYYAICDGNHIQLTLNSFRSEYTFKLLCSCTQIKVYIQDRIGNEIILSESVSVSQISDSELTDLLSSQYLNKNVPLFQFAQEAIIIGSYLVHEEQIDPLIQELLSEYDELRTLYAATILTKIEEIWVKNNHYKDVVILLIESLYPFTVNEYVFNNETRIRTLNLLLEFGGVIEEEGISKQCAELLLIWIEILSSLKGSLDYDKWTPNSKLEKINISEQFLEILSALSAGTLSLKEVGEDMIQLNSNHFKIYLQKVNLEILSSMDESFTHTFVENSVEASLTLPSTFEDEFYDNMIFNFECIFMDKNPIYLNHEDNSNDIKTEVVIMELSIHGYYSKTTGEYIQYIYPYPTLSQLPSGVDIYLPKNSTFTENDQEYSAECMHYDQVNYKWESDGCSIIEQKSTYIHCRCDHLSIFGVNFTRSSKESIDFIGDWILEVEANNEPITVYLEYVESDLLDKDGIAIYMMLFLLLTFMIFSLIILCLERKKAKKPIKRKSTLAKTIVHPFMEFPTSPQAHDSSDSREVLQRKYNQQQYMVSAACSVSSKNVTRSVSPKFKRTITSIGRKSSRNLNTLASKRTYRNKFLSTKTLSVSVKSNNGFNLKPFDCKCSRIEEEEESIDTNKVPIKIDLGATIKPSFDSIATNDPFKNVKNLPAHFFASKLKNKPEDPPLSARNLMDSASADTSRIKEKEPTKAPRKSSYQEPTIYDRPNSIQTFAEEHRTLGIIIKEDIQYTRFCRLCILYISILLELMGSSIVSLLNLVLILKIVISIFLPVVIYLVLFPISNLLKTDFQFGFHSFEQRKAILFRNSMRLHLGCLLLFVLAGIGFCITYWFSLETRADGTLEMVKYYGFSIFSELIIFQTLECYLKTLFLSRNWERQLYWGKRPSRCFIYFFTGRIITLVFFGPEIFHKSMKLESSKNLKL